MTARSAPRLRSSLLIKLLLINLPVIVLAIVVIWSAIQQLSADYLSTLMQEYDIAPDTTHAMFTEAVERYLLWAGLAALVLATGLSLLLTRQVLKPLRAMQDVTRQIAAGHYEARVAPTTSDELAELGRSLNNMATALDRNEYLRRKLVNDVAHELRTPLTNLRGYVEGIADGVVPSDEATLELLQGELMRLIRLVDDLHALNEAEAGRLDLAFEAIALHNIVERELNLIRPVIESKGISVTRDLASSADHVRADGDKIAQVLRNLLENACRFTPDNGQIHIGSCRHDGYTRLTVANTGPEIPAAERSHIFERFYRAERARSRATGGTGIGLAIVRELVEAHGGRVAAESGNGWTHFVIDLPSAQPDA